MTENAKAQENAPETIEVGATDGDFRLYKAKAIREAAEAYLLGQERSYSATEARATNLLGWTIAGAVALASRMLIAGFTPSLFAATCFLFFSAVCSCSVLWPGVWHTIGFVPGEEDAWRLLDDTKVETELSFNECLTQSYAAAIVGNRKVSKRAGGRMRKAWLLAFSAAPVALLTYRLTGT